MCHHDIPLRSSPYLVTCRFDVEILVPLNSGENGSCPKFALARTPETHCVSGQRFGLVGEERVDGLFSLPPDMSARSSNYLFLPHPNTPIAVFCACSMPLIYAEGGRMRWGSIFVGASLYTMFGMSAAWWCQLRDLETSSKLGMAASVAFVYATAFSNWFPIKRFVPRKVCLGVGAAYFTMHTAYYIDCQVAKSWLDKEIDDD
jgi:hypothetical protein